MALFPVSSKDVETKDISITSDNANITVTTAECWKKGSHVHGFVLLTATGTITQAYSKTLAQGFPVPSTTVHGMVSAKNGTALATGQMGIDTSGKLLQSVISTMNSGDYLVATIDYLV